MIFGQSKLELKVGIFVFIGLVILTYFVLSIGNFKTLTSGYEVNFIFNFADGVKAGAPVRFAGVSVGEVKEIGFFSVSNEARNQVRVVCRIDKAVKVPVGSRIWINTLGLLGEKYIEIIPGEDYNNLLMPSQTLAGVDPIPMQELSLLTKNIAHNLDDIISKIKNKEGTVGRLLYDDSLYKELEAFIIDIRKYPWKLFYRTKEKPGK